MSDTLLVEYSAETLSLDSGETLLLTEQVLQLLSEGIMGPPGAAGSSVVMPWHEEAFVLSGNQTVFTLSLAPQTGSVSLFVNGLRQRNNNFTVVSTTVTVTGFTPTAGDTVAIVYQ